MIRKTVINMGVLASLASCLIVGAEDVEFVSAKIESCKGCSLNRLPEVKAFIYNDVPKYENVEFKPNPGAPPELVLFDKNEKEVERIPLSNFNREQLNALLVGKGFIKKQKSNNNEL